MDTHPAKRTSVALLLVLTLALGVLGAAQDPSLRLVSTVWPPFTDVDGKPRFALDLVEAATSRIGLTTRTTMVDAPGFTPAPDQRAVRRQRGRVAGQRAQSERCCSRSRIWKIVADSHCRRQGSDVSAASLSALKGKRVAIVGGYAYGDGIDTVGPTFFRTNSEVDSLRELLDGQVDYALIDELVVTSIANAYPEQARTRLHVGTASMLTRQLFFAIRRTVPGAASIIERFNAQLIAMVADRTYHRLLHVSVDHGRRGRRWLAGDRSRERPGRRR